MGYRDIYKKNHHGTMVYLSGYIMKSNIAINKYPCYNNGTAMILYNGNYECYQCVFCQQWFLWEDITIDHIIPKRNGGTDDLSNLQCTCRSCSMIKSAIKQKVKDALGIEYKHK